MFTEIIERLESFGYDAGIDDHVTIEFAKGKIENHVRNYCGIEQIPCELKFTIIDAICVEFLLIKSCTDDLVLNNVCIDNIKSIAEGDTNVCFDNKKSMSDRLIDLRKFLMRDFEINLKRYRRVVW